MIGTPRRVTAQRKDGTVDLNGVKIWYFGPGQLFNENAHGFQISSEVVIGPGSVVGADAVIGAGSRLHPNVTVCHGVVIGARAILHSGCVIGGDGFGDDLHSQVALRLRPHREREPAARSQYPARLGESEEEVASSPVLLGEEPMPDRSDVEEFIGVIDTLRNAVWGDP